MKNTVQPLVSIILPIYNARVTLEASLKSLLSQSHTNIEIIIVDDHSNDGSYAMLRRLKEKDARIRIIRNKKRYGITISLNRAFAKTKGMHIAFADVKGKNLKDRVKKELSYLLSHPKTVVVGSQCLYTNQFGKRIRKSSFPLDHASVSSQFITGLSMQFESVMINKYLIPKDLLQLPCAYTSFQQTKKKSLYADILMKLLPYGDFANIKDILYSQQQPQIQPSSISQITHLLKLWVKSVAVYETRMPLKTLFTPLIKQA